MEGGEGGQGDDEVVELFLGDAVECEETEESAGEDGGDEESVDEEGLAGDKGEVELEGDLDPVEDEVEPGGGAHELDLFEADGEEEDDGDGTGGVGEHGGEPREESDGPGEPPLVRDVIAGEEAEVAEDLDEEEGQDDGGDEAVDVGGGDGLEDEEPDEDADEGGEDETSEGVPMSAPTEVGDGEDVGDHEHGEHDAESLATGEGDGEEGDGEDAEAGDAGLGDAGEETGGEGGEPLKEREVGNGSDSMI